MVPGEGIEPPTFGLQNRCSTAELARHYEGFLASGLEIATGLPPELPLACAESHIHPAPVRGRGTNAADTRFLPSGGGGKSVGDLP